MVYTIQSDICSLSSINESYYEFKLNTIHFEQEVFETIIQDEYRSLKEAGSFRFDFKSILKKIIGLFSKFIDFLKKKMREFTILYMRIIPKRIRELKARYKDNIVSENTSWEYERRHVRSASYLTLDRGLNELGVFLDKINDYIKGYYKNTIDPAIKYEYNNIGKQDRKELLNPTQEMLLVEEEIVRVIDVYDKSLKDYIKSMFREEPKDISVTDTIMLGVLESIIYHECESGVAIKKLNKVLDQQIVLMETLKGKCISTMNKYDSKHEHNNDPEFDVRIKKVSDLMMKFSAFTVNKSTEIQQAALLGVKEVIDETITVCEKMKDKKSELK